MSAQLLDLCTGSRHISHIARSSWLYVAIVLSCALFSSIGCGDGRPRRVPVSGRVLIDGEPLAYGYIRFVPSGARASSAELNERGEFTLTCYQSEDGVVPGLHRVEVNAGETLSSTRVFWHAPKKYAQYRTSGLTQEIDNSTDSLVIELSWNGGEPFVEKTKYSE